MCTFMLEFEIYLNICNFEISLYKRWVSSALKCVSNGFSNL